MLLLNQPSFTKRESERGGYGGHIKNGAKKVVLTVTAKDKKLTYGGGWRE